MSLAGEVRDQADQAEIHYNQPLRTKVRRLEDEVLALKRLLRENDIDWRARSGVIPATNGRITRSSSRARCKPLSKPLPHIPVEVQLRILTFALTSSTPIVDPLCKVKQEHLLLREKAKGHQLAIHFLTTCKAYYVEGNKVLWSNNSFVFTNPEALRNFSEVNLKFRRHIKEVNFRLIARFYDDEERTHKISRHHHPDLKKPVSLAVQRRPKESPLARRGLRVYGWYQLVDFLTALLPPFDPERLSAPDVVHTKPAPPLLPCLDKLRIDFVNFKDDTFTMPPAQLHEVASHQLGCTLNEVILTGLPSDDSGLRACNELAGLLRDEGLLIDHAPSMIALKNSIRPLHCGDGDCHYSAKVVRAIRHMGEGHHDDAYQHFGADFPPAPADDGDPPPSIYHSCRTIWKRVPVKIYGSDKRKWMLFDRMSGLPWEDVQAEATMFDDMGSDDGTGEGIVCDNCGAVHPGAIPSLEMMDLYDDLP
ncbi:hypothetical protein GGR53DRAFT_512497 [Hypoxylon sp. FL1150]|nr:hypothetical protein GGR53DRAFT_512497 [Hypoxylon sp. FL1150]